MKQKSYPQHKTTNHSTSENSFLCEVCGQAGDAGGRRQPSPEPLSLLSPQSASGYNPRRPCLRLRRTNGADCRLVPTRRRMGDHPSLSEMRRTPFQPHRGRRQPCKAPCHRRGAACRTSGAGNLYGRRTSGREVRFRMQSLILEIAKKGLTKAFSCDRMTKIFQNGASGHDRSCDIGNRI